jgi:hypothetical protein
MGLDTRAARRDGPVPCQLREVPRRWVKSAASASVINAIRASNSFVAKVFLGEKRRCKVPVAGGKVKSLAASDAERMVAAMEKVHKVFLKYAMNTPRFCQVV